MKRKRILLVVCLIVAASSVRATHERLGWGSYWSIYLAAPRLAAPWQR